MNTAAFASVMLLIVFAFIGAMIWAYRKNDYKEEKQKVVSDNLNNLNDTLMTITTFSDKLIQEQEDQKRAEEEAEAKKLEDDPLAKMELLESRQQVIQNKNHIKKSAADEYFEKTKNVANEILQPKTK